MSAYRWKQKTEGGINSRQVDYNDNRGSGGMGLIWILKSIGVSFTAKKMWCNGII